WGSRLVICRSAARRFRYFTCQNRSRSEVQVRIFLVAICLFLYTGEAWSQDNVKIGFIDIQRAITESQAGKRAKERFQAQVKKAEAELLKEKQEIERLKGDLDKKGPLLKEEEKRSLEADLQRRVVNYQRGMQDQQQQLRQKEGEMTSDILKELEKIVNEVGKAEKFTLILERSQILYSDQGIDITNRVIEAYNARSKSK
ncbi:MAG TPA: OmpH family outer membrane protein, partial [Candidatus Binatia bacterium]|nr:OmpH family outer membrane protein [Candidatus Binatia bacterium]